MKNSIQMHSSWLKGKHANSTKNLDSLTQINKKKLNFECWRTKMQTKKGVTLCGSWEPYAVLSSLGMNAIISKGTLLL